MTIDKKQAKNNSCPVCGSRISANATRCLVCGTNLQGQPDKQTPKTDIQSPKMPSVTLNLPLAIGLVIVLLAIGAGVVYAFLNQTGMVVEPTVTVTASSTATITVTPTNTLTPTLQPTNTPLPDIEYVVQANDDCLSIAFLFNVSVNSIISKNNLSATCNNLVVGSTLLIPQPTPTASPQPTATLSEVDATEAACTKLDYTVSSGETLSSIAANYNVSIESIKEWNAITSDVVYEGQTISIPLCERLPTAGPTPTATLPPPYQAPNLLLPVDGAPFTNANDTISLQWASVGTLRENEAYAITVEDVTGGEGRKIVQYVTDTKYIVPASFRPNDTIPHIIRWTVVAVRQTRTGTDGQPVYEPAGSVSTPRTFIWWANVSATPTP
ncbi:MAG: LysM peptidoglycan-binding domain-containing protein [Anaerolineaceae bacterium]